ncbi:HlyD family efflux transporter periplasmic adaptor subunit [Fusibacter paucivorans]|uniref:HlyD family efflux transporter periplasmic adaptor subunit n=1 Tax=Fusibacter paucivorans TaxID=76009 RepID=A0ABS5PKK2_9FIRM|nr:HlyD family efflux transporter periplasmic adaptor subunit [Fusibacter paucivorans]MBS7525700.1 HlyD family efflux transporter periplasmic adaptor subunit [Fusibacter paucivorans]
MKKKVRIGLIAVFGVICIAVAIAYAMKPLTVDILKATQADIYDYVEEDGAIVSDQSVTLSAKTTAQVSAANFENGDLVREGDTVLILDDTAIQSRIDQVTHQISAMSEDKDFNLVSLKYQISQQKIAVDQLKEEAAYVGSQYDQAQALYTAGAISETALTDAKQRYDSLQLTTKQNSTALASLQAQYSEILNANSGIATLEAQLTSLELEKSYTAVQANAEGLLTNFDIHVGDYVTASYPLASIVNPDAYKIETYVLTEDAYNLKEGDAVDLVIKRNGENFDYKGEIYSVAPNAVETVSALGLAEKRVKVLISPDTLAEDVKVGYDVKVKFISEFQLDAIAIPKTSIFYEGDDAFVFKKVEGKAVLTKIETGMETDSKMVVTSGLTDGDEIIKNYKIAGLENGKRVD